MDINEINRGLDSCRIPERMRGGIVRYITEGIIPGDFLQAIITNDLKKAVWLADEENTRLLREYVLFFYNYAPAGCWGSHENMIEIGRASCRERV